MKGNKGRAKLGLPFVLFFCSLFFLAGFFVSMLVSQSQVLSWKPRALYFPKFATAEQCQGIIKIAKSNLEPSKLALRKGETTENTKGIRTSTHTFISASEDSTGILDQIEQKIARATMIPRDHGEAFNILRYEVGQSYASHYDAFKPAEYGPQTSQRMRMVMPHARVDTFESHISASR